MQNGQILAHFVKEKLNINSKKAKITTISVEIPRIVCRK